MSSLSSGPIDTLRIDGRLNLFDDRSPSHGRLAGTTRLRGNLDLHNIFNAGDVLSMNTRYGDVWQNPITILRGRLLKLSAQFDF